MNEKDKENNSIHLSPERKKELIEIHRTTKDKKYADRIKTIILLNDGYSKTEIERILLIDKKTIYKYMKDFKKNGLLELLKDDYIPYWGKLTKEEQEILIKDLRESLFSTAKEICDHVKRKFNKKFRAESMVKLLHRLGFSYKKTKHVPGKADRKKQEAFVEQYETLRNELKKAEKIYFMDAVHAQHNSLPAYGWIEKGTEYEIKSNTGRDRININGVYSPIDYEVIAKQYGTINAQATINLFEKIEKKHPELKRIYIISDNARYYRSKMVSEYLSTSRITLIPLPAYSPNLNLIERLWKLMKKKVVYNKYYEKFFSFKQAIDFFFKNINRKKLVLKSLMAENFHLFNTT